MWNDWQSYNDCCHQCVSLKNKNLQNERISAPLPLQKYLLNFYSWLFVLICFNQSTKLFNHRGMVVVKFMHAEVLIKRTWDKIPLLMHGKKINVKDPGRRRGGSALDSWSKGCRFESHWPRRKIWENMKCKQKMPRVGTH